MQARARVPGHHVCAGMARAQCSWLNKRYDQRRRDHPLGLNKLEYNRGLTVRPLPRFAEVASPFCPCSIFSPLCSHRPLSPRAPSATGSGKGCPVARCGSCTAGAGVHPGFSSHRPPPPPTTCPLAAVRVTSPPPSLPVPRGAHTRARKVQ